MPDLQPRRQAAAPAPLHVALLAVPDAVISTLGGMYDVMNASSVMGVPRPGGRAPFRAEIVGESAGALELASGVPIQVQRGIDAVEASDIVIVPSVLVRNGGWHKGRHPGLVAWLQEMHARGALL